MRRGHEGSQCAPSGITTKEPSAIHGFVIFTEPPASPHLRILSMPGGPFGSLPPGPPRPPGDPDVPHPPPDTGRRWGTRSTPSGCWRPPPRGPTPTPRAPTEGQREREGEGWGRPAHRHLLSPPSVAPGGRGPVVPMGVSMRRRGATRFTGWGTGLTESLALHPRRLAAVAHHSAGAQCEFLRDLPAAAAHYLRGLTLTLKAFGLPPPPLARRTEPRDPVARPQDEGVWHHYDQVPPGLQCGPQGPHPLDPPTPELPGTVGPCPPGQTMSSLLRLLGRRTGLKSGRFYIYT